MFVACVPLNLGSRKVKEGDPVPEADHWSEVVKRAHLNLGWIKHLMEEVDDLRVPQGSAVGAMDGARACKPKKSKKTKEGDA